MRPPNVYVILTVNDTKTECVVNLHLNLSWINEIPPNLYSRVYWPGLQYISDYI